MKLAGKTVLITGAAKRIGREIALTLAGRCSCILIHCFHSQKEAVELQGLIRKNGTEAFVIQSDFSPVNRNLTPVLLKFLKRVHEVTDQVDILINNASIFYKTPIHKISEKNWDDFQTINLKVPFMLSLEFGKRMVKQKSGKIINLADWTAMRPLPDYLPYAISKAGLVAATQGLAKALAPYVQVNAIAPGPILPPKGAAALDMKKTISKTLLKRFGSPQDIANAVLFLIEGTDYVTGACIPVDGGSLNN